MLDEKSIHDDMLVIAGDNVLDFSFAHFIAFVEEKDTSCVMTYEENELAKQQRTGIITFDEKGLITSYEEKPKQPKGNHAVSPFYFYKGEDTVHVPEALVAGCNADVPGGFAACLSRQVPVHAFVMPGKRYDIGNHESYAQGQQDYKGITK